MQPSIRKKTAIFPSSSYVWSDISDFSNMPARPVVNEIPADRFTPIILGPSDTSNLQARGFCHTSQTDWLQTAGGECVLTLFFAGEFHYIPMYMGMEHFVEVGRKVWHGALNLSSRPAYCYNLLFRQGRKPHPRDYELRTLPYEHNLESARRAQAQECRVIWNPRTHVETLVSGEF